MQAAVAPTLRTDLPTAASRARIAVYVVKGLSLAGTFAFTLWAATGLLVRSDAEVSAAVMALLVAFGLLGITRAAVRETLGWRRPLARLARRIDTIIDGGGKPDDLADLPPNLAPLRGPLLALLRRNRELEAAVKRAEEEARQRVLNRTDALERKLGALQLAANRDTLTQCMNRRAMDEQLPKLIDGCRARQVDCVLLMIDVDHFKQLNDALGHAAGDELLRSIGQVIRSGVREGDVPFRYGGDEFVVVLPGADVEQAGVLAERLRQLTDGLTKTHRTLSQRPQLSIGIAAISRLPTTASATDLLAAADAKLYAIKRARKVQRAA